MRIAVLISGRAARFEVCLMPLLNSCKNHDFDIFMSINDDDSEYYNYMKNELGTMLKGCKIQNYILPESFVFDINHNESLWYHHRIIDNKPVPYNQLSMYFNDMNAFEMASRYSSTNNFEYDMYMKLRSDICNTSMPSLNERDQNEYKLYSVIPQCNMTALANYKVPIVSDAWVWGNKKTMSIYCNTYNYVLQQLNDNCGKYLVHYESGVTDNIYEHSIPVIYINNPYNLDRNRRILEKKIETNLAPIDGSLPNVGIQNFENVLNLPVNPI